MDRLRTSVAMPWVVAVIGFPIGGLLAQTIAGPAATVPAAVTAAIGQIETSTEAVALGALSGVLIGAAQAALFMRAIANAWVWVLVTGIAWAVGWLIITARVGVALGPGWPVYGASGALVSQIITAIALWRLVPSHEALRAGA
jgi:hypothetical protein